MEHIMESEKVSVNIKNDKLSSIDLLIEEGIYSNRSEFINEAISLLIDKNQMIIDNIINIRNKTLNPNQWFIGVMSLDENYLLKFKKQGIKLTLKGFGSLYLSKDISEELLDDSIEQISKKIKVHGTSAQMAIVAKKIK